MNPTILIDAIVQQTTVLIAQLSTAAGVRAPLATIADQVFVELAREIERQGVSKKVAADMFGLALRTYQAKVNRLQESVTEKGTSLWGAVFAYIEQENGRSRGQLQEHFEADDPMSLGAVLKDLCDSGLIYRTGSGAATRYRAVSEEERESVLEAQDDQALAAILRVAIYRGTHRLEGLSRKLGMSVDRLAPVVDALIDEGLVTKTDEGELATGGIFIPAGSTIGWEAAVFDHYQALVTALTRKLALGSTVSPEHESTGGSTITFEISKEHPLRNEVHGLLSKVRQDVNALWKRVGDHNARVNSTPNNTTPKNGEYEGVPDKSIPESEAETVTFYFGQSVSPGETP